MEHVTGMGEKTNVYRVSVEKPGRKRQVGKLGHRLEGNIKMDFKAMGGSLWTGFIRLRIGTGGCLV